MLNRNDMRKTPILLVMWLDASASNGWTLPEDGKLVETYTLGYLVFEDKDKIVIASTLNDLGHVSGVTTIPKGWIKKTRMVIKRGTRRNKKVRRNKK